jgi:TRAP-type C4-dicarboxylate transport system substrate-binding protein
MSRFTRRAVIGAMVASPAIVGAARLGYAAPRTLKISHQFPGGTLEQGDFRDRLTRRFAADVETRTKGELKFDIYPGESLVKAVPQFDALRKGAIDMSVYPLAYAGGQFQELNIGLMPAMVTSYEQGFAWKKAPIGAELEKAVEARGVKIITWIWQAGGIASRSTAIIEPPDVKGLKIRGGSKEMDLMLGAAGGIVSSVSSAEIYPNMQTGTLDAAITSSTSLISYRLDELAKNLTTGRGRSFWYMFEPLLISKQVFDSLPKDQQTAITEVGLSLEPFGIQSAKDDDQRIVDVYGKAKVGVHDMSDASVAKWRTVAESSAWTDFSKRNADCERFLGLAKAVA